MSCDCLFYLLVSQQYHGATSPARTTTGLLVIQQVLSLAPALYYNCGTLIPRDICLLNRLDKVETDLVSQPSQFSS